MPIIFVVLLVAVSTFYKAHALVVAPIIAMAALKLAVFFVSLISPPIIAIFQIIKKHKRAEALLMAFGLIVVLFILVFSALKIYENSKTTSTNSIALPAGNKMELAPVPNTGMQNDRIYLGNTPGIPAPVQPVVYKTPYTFYIMPALKTMGILFVVFLFPVMFALLLINSRRKLWTPVELTLLCLMIDYGISFSCGFALLAYSYFNSL
jgi:hypothetical protein